MVEYSLDLQNINLSAIRTVRVLRPLKAINRVPSKSPIDTTITQYLPDRVTDLLPLWQDSTGLRPGYMHILHYYYTEQKYQCNMQSVGPTFHNLK